MAEEKFISIEYNTWNNKYLPMEAENLRLQASIDELNTRLAQEIGTNTHTIYLSIRDRCFTFYVMHGEYPDVRHFDHEAKIAILEVEKGFMVKSDIDFKAIEDAVKTVITKMEKILGVVRF